MDNRERILEAASRVYAQHGFRGATTRLIAQAAGVNEVTLFRLFGSKQGLFDALLHTRMEFVSAIGVPDVPGDDAEAELTAWCTATLSQMRASRSLLRKMIGEMEERPTAALTACQGPQCAEQMLMRYVGQLRARGRATGDGADDRAAVAMLMGAMFGDATCRELMPDSMPQPEEAAPAMYVRVFLRSIGVAVGAAAPPAGESAAPDTRRKRAS